MSEYQYIAFRAIDTAVSEENLEYMRRQSSRAEITPWSFQNEYNFGDFGGNVLEMLRRGYDLYVHYANFGTRKLLIRFPHGLPNKTAVKPYFAKDSLRFSKDKQGPGGTLCIEPFHEPGDLEDLWEIDGLLDRLAPLRAEILDGDLRPLYVAHMVMACDSDHDPEETKEPPVPAGLGELTDAQHALTELYGLGDVIAAAARGVPRSATHGDQRSEREQWLQKQPQASKDAWLAQLLSDRHSTVRGEILAAFRKGRKGPVWPTVRRDRTIAELEAAAAEIRQAADRKSAEDAARRKAKRLAALAADPARSLRETERLVEERTTKAYREIAKLLAELRESLAGTDQAGLAEQQARKLKTENPTLHRLSSELRTAGFLAK